MNKNTLRQLIVTEMILADVNGGGHVPPKKRSLLEMMDDSYLSELEDGRFAHSMKIMLETGAADWDNYSQHNADGRAPAETAPAAEATAETPSTDPAAEATAETPSTDPAAEAVAPAVPEVDPEAQAEIPDKADNDISGRDIGGHDVPAVPGQIGGGGDSQGSDDEQPDTDVNNPSGGLAYLDDLAQKEINDASQPAADQKNTAESRLSLIGLLYDT